jgi:hypothetical protein
MSWENYEKVRGFVQKAGMSARPEFYSGRDAMLCDLNGEQLEKIYQSIVKDFGEEAGKNYIHMVKDIEVLSATKFLNSLYSLCNNDWMWNNTNEESNILIDGEGSAWGTIGSVLFGGKYDDTSSIKNGFLRNHGIQPSVKRDERGFYCEDGYWYR